jgi:hypothetical protein
MRCVTKAVPIERNSVLTPEQDFKVWTSIVMLSWEIINLMQSNNDCLSVWSVALSVILSCEHITNMCNTCKK